MRRRTARLGLVVPALAEEGGVAALARFLAETALGSGRFELRMLSLATSARDPQSQRILSPSTWFRGPTAVDELWCGLRFTHFGARAVEIEYMRYMPREPLSEAVRQCDLIQVAAGFPAWANAVARLGRPVALHCATRAITERQTRDQSARGTAGWWRKAMTGWTDRLDERALRVVDAVQVMNPWMLKYVHEQTRGRDTVVRYAPPGIDAGYFHVPEDRRLDGCPTVLWVGRLNEPRKNIGLLLRAFAHLVSRSSFPARLVLAGSGDVSDDFWPMADALGLRESVEVIVNPSRDALRALYQAASVFTLTSNEEGLGIVLLEAMACGVPVVSTRSGGPDGIISDGVDGYLVAREDDRAIAARVKALLEDANHNRAIGMAGRHTVERRYAQELTGEVFLETWELLIARGRR